jgi:hypothetical protein
MTISQGADTLTTPLVLELSDASKKAVEAVEAVGGKVYKVYFNKLGLCVHCCSVCVTIDARALQVCGCTCCHRSLKAN